MFLLLSPRHPIEVVVELVPSLELHIMTSVEFPIMCLYIT
jgi:hypothetical protein